MPPLRALWFQNFQNLQERKWLSFQFFQCLPDGFSKEGALKEFIRGLTHPVLDTENRLAVEDAEGFSLHASFLLKIWGKHAEAEGDINREFEILDPCEFWG